LNFWIFINQVRKLPNIPGTMHMQLVSMAPLTTSRSGKTANMSSAKPTVWQVSAKKTKTKSKKGGIFHDLKKQIRTERMKAPT
jgi:cytochrome c556